MLTSGCGDASCIHVREDVMDTPAHYVHWSFILISLPNLVLIIVMLALFAVALVAPFPGHGDSIERRKR
jgi:hypothetical protein